MRGLMSCACEAALNHMHAFGDHAPLGTAGQ